VLIDNQNKNWNRWSNSYWPATYLIDRKGQVRGLWNGELDYNNSGEYKKAEAGIELLLSEK
jgi:peroxiredoxin